MSTSEMRAAYRKQRDWNFVEDASATHNGTGTRRAARRRKDAKTFKKRQLRRHRKNMKNF